MYIRVLGTLELSGDGPAGVLGGEKLRALLAALIVRRGGVVSIDQLVEELWPQQAPATAVNLIHQYMAKLRRATGENGAGLLRTRSRGYQLVLPDDALDAQVFERLTVTGVVKLRQGDHDGAATVLTQALDLWRGPAFCDVPRSAAVGAEATRLEQLRLEALEARIEAKLALGRHATLAPELQSLTEEHPLREGLWAQLILTLYRCGRQAEALEAYRRLYRKLGEELGIEPTQKLRDLHQQILTDDPDLRPKLATLVPVPTPRQLPAATPDFVGRQDSLTRLDALVADSAGSGDGPATVTITAIAGTAGIGKTTLAVHWAHQIADRYPDGQLYVNLRGFDPSGQVLAPADAIRGFLEAFGVAPQRIPVDLDAQAALYRSLLSGKRVLVVLDNARDTDQIRPLLPGSPGCLVVVTSRNDLAGLVAKEGALPLTLDVVSPAEARQLLTHRLGQSRVTAEPEAVEQIIAACARLPLALAIVAARAATNPAFSLAALAAELHDNQTRLDALTSAHTSADVRAVFSWSYTQLSVEAQRLFRLLGLHPGPDISAPAAASLAGAPVRQVRPLLSELAGTHVVTEHALGRYTFHDLLRAYAADLTHTHDTEAERDAARAWMLDHYVQTAYIANRLLAPQRDPITLTLPRRGVTPERPATYDQAMGWFTREHPVLLGVLHQAGSAGSDSQAWQLGWTLNTFLYRRGHWHDLAAAWKAALDATQRLDDRPAQAGAHRGLAGAYTQLGRFADARTHLHHALHLHCELGDRTGQAHSHYQLAQLCGRRSRHADALDQAQHALAQFQSAGHRDGQARALNLIGWQHAHLDRHHIALTYCRQALTLFEDLGDRDGQASTWDSLGYAHHHLQQYEDATACYQHALDLYRDLGNRYHEAHTLTHLADAQHAAGDTAGACQSWRQALGILAELHHPDAEEIRAKLGRLA